MQRTADAPKSRTTRRTAHDTLFSIMVALAPVARPFDVWIEGYRVPPMDWVFLALALAWGIAVLTGRARIRPGGFYRVLACFWAALALSTAFSQDPESSATKLAGQTYLVGLAALAYNLTDGARAASAWLLGTAVTVAATLAGVALFYAGATDPEVNLVLSPFGSLPPGGYPRVRGLTPHANVLCAYLTVSCMLALAMRAAGRLRPALFWPLAAGLWVAALLTLSPGLGGLFLVAAVWARLSLVEAGRPRAGALALAAGCAAAVAFFLAVLVAPTPYGWPEFTVLGLRFEPSTRAAAWVTACDTIAAHPVVGKGLGLAVSAVPYPDPAGGISFLTDAHNVWLSIAGQAGIAGVAAFAALVAYLLRGLPAFAVRGSERELFTTALALAFLGGFYYHALTTSFEDTRFMWVLFGMLAGVKQSADRS
jgi:putative inorganic carbon (hco3(-)) transporter